MAGIFDGIDHCVILVRDLNVARDRMAQLGFTVTPRGIHSDHMGTANHCMMFNNAYFEILGICEPTEFNAAWRSKIERREGLEAVPLASGNIDALRNKLAERGISLPEAIDFSRPVDLPEGTTEAIFRLIMIPSELTPNITMFVIQHFTRDVVWHRDYLNHANGAIGVRGVTAVHEQPQEVVPAYERLFGSNAVSIAGNGVRIDTGKGDIHFVKSSEFANRFPDVTPDPSANAPYLAALSLDVANRILTADYLNNHGVPHIVLPRGTLCVPPLDACGTLIEFV